MLQTLIFELKASQTAALLNLHSMFGIEEFLIPLILQDKLACVDEFLAGSTTHQVQLVTFLDSCLGKPGSLRALLEQTAS